MNGSPYSATSSRVLTLAEYRQYHPEGGSPHVFVIDSTAAAIRFFSSSRLSSQCSVHRQPCEQTSCPARWIHSPTPGFRSSATAAAKKVTLMPYSSKRRSSRQTPARLPYSNTDSAK